MPPKTVKATCKVGACEPQCGLELDIEEGVITAARPDKSHPISKGYACIKGLALPEYQNDTDRLLDPIKRVGGNWTSITWDQATTEIGEKLRRIADQYGPNAIATYWGNAADTTGMICANSICSALGSPNSFNVLSLEYTDRGAVAQRVLGDQTLILQPDADNAHFALLLGTNPLVTQGMTLLQRRPRVGGDLMAISKRGGKVVVVDPRVTETTRIADQHLPIIPGTDLFLLLGMIRRILLTHTEDQLFLSKNARGQEQWMQIVKDYDIVWAASVTGIDESTINQLADEFAQAESGFVTTRVGVQTGPNTTLTEWAVLTLNAITGNIDRPGGVYYHGGAIDNTELIHKFTRRKNPASSRVGKYPQVFGGPPCTVFSDDVLSDDPDRIRALIVIAGNPVISFPSTKKIEQALGKLDLLVCIDLYKNDTGTFAHYNLPATTIYEKGGLHILTQPFEPYPFAEWRPKVVEPKGQARAEWDITRDICRAARIRFLNHPIIDTLDKLMGFFGSKFEEKHLAQYLLLSGMSRKKMSVKKLMRAEGGIKFGDVEWGKFLQSGLMTADRKIQLCPTEFADELARVLSSQACANEDFPFLLISGGRRLASFNTWTHNMPSMMERLRGNYAAINEEDGKRLGIANGRTIKVTSATGTLDIPVALSSDVRQGVIVIQQFWGHHYNSGQRLANRHPGVNVNLLHDDRVRDAFCGMPVFNGTPCKVELARTNMEIDALVTSHTKVH